MPKLSINDIARIAEAEVFAGGRALEGILVTGYSFDTRFLERGDLFFALRGEHRDGHAFVSDACRKGAVGAVVARKADEVPADFVQVVVESPAEALQRIAATVRKRLDIPVIAISGSNGKTTTKDMLAMILASKMPIHKSPGNFNNHIGVPLSILGLDDADRALVVELGSNHRGEIKKLCAVADPTIGVVTNVGRAHIGHFGSVEEIAREKTDLIRCLRPGGTGVVNADDSVLMSALTGAAASLVTFGTERTADFRTTEITHTPGAGTTFKINGEPVELRTPGVHNVYNAVAAIATASLFSISVKEAAYALASLEPLRMKVITSGDLTIIDDTYNANPDSIRAALDEVSAMNAPRKVFIMGEMLELGDRSEELHADVGSRVVASNIDVLIGIGGLTQATVSVARASGLTEGAAFFFPTKAEAKRRIRKILKPHDVVLVKGSRMAGLEEICDFLRQVAVEGRI